MITHADPVLTSQLPGNMSSKIQTVRAALAATVGDPDRRRKTQEFLLAVFDFGLECLRGQPGSSIAARLASNVDNVRDVARDIAQACLMQSTIDHWIIDEISSRLLSHAETVTPSVACRTRSGLEFLVSEFSPNVRVYTGQLSIADDQRDWAKDSVPFKEYLDALLHADTLEEYDKRMRYWIEYYRDTVNDPEAGDVMRENVQVPAEVPESHWWWKELSPCQ